MNVPLVSVIVPAYQAARYLPALCESLQAQTYRHFEVLLLDDGSPDQPERVLAPFLRDPRFRLISWPVNLGVNRATTKLLALMAGEFWCNPGADDILKPEFIEARVELLRQNPSAVMVHGRAEFIDEFGAAAAPLPQVERLPARLDAMEALRILLEHNIINTPSVMVRAHVTRLVLPFFQTDWRYAQDWYCWLLHLASGFDLLSDAECRHQYRIHAASVTQDPKKAALRLAELRLVPLCALSAAARFSPWAAALWAEFGESLYSLWLRRAIRLRREGVVPAAWLQMAGAAYHGPSHRVRSLTAELVRHGWKLMGATFRDRRARAASRFPVSGLAEVNHPVFQ